MNLETYYEYCLSKKGVTEHFPFDQDTLVFKVGGKMFALSSLNQWEKGEPSVTMGAWSNAIAALGMHLQLQDHEAAKPTPADRSGWWPVRIALADYPQLWRYLHCLALWRIPRVGRH